MIALTRRPRTTVSLRPIALGAGATIREIAVAAIGRAGGTGATIGGWPTVGCAAARWSGGSFRIGRALAAGGFVNAALRRAAVIARVLALRARR